MVKTNRFSTQLCKQLLLCITATVIFLPFGFSQKSNKYHKTADALYNKGAYEKAAFYYIKALAVDPNNDNIVAAFIPPGHKNFPKKADDNPAYLTYQLAECFRQLNDNINAQKMYEQFFTFKQESFYPLARYWYAQSLKTNNQPEAAEKQFNTFLDNHKENDKFAADAKVSMQACRDAAANNKGSKDQIIVTKLPWPINGNDNSFAFQRIDDSSFIFSGIRPEETDKKTKYPIRIYSGKFNQPPTISQIAIKGEAIDMAAASLSPDRLTIYFTAWKTKTKNTIFVATRKSLSDGWDAPTEMPQPVNEKRYSSKHPYITSDGKFLLFSSDRPGGKGGFDIWYVEMQNGKVIGEAKNAGSLINTKSEEVSPFYDTEQHILYFASDRKGGIGGMDIYSSQGLLEKNAWDNPSCLPYPINSAKDETHYRRYANTDTAYLSSNRDFEMNLEVFSVVNFKRPPYQGILVETTDKEEKAQTVTTDSKTTPNANVIQVIPVGPTKSSLEATIDSMNRTVESRYNTHFDFNSSKIREEDKYTLDDVITRLNNDPSLNIVAASFTDCKGSLNANKRVARRRARAIRRYLIKNGIEASRIVIDYHAAEHYVIPCKDDATYDKPTQIANRRSDILLTKEEQPTWLPSGKEIDADKIVESLKDSYAKEKVSKISERKARRLAAAAAKEKTAKNKKASGLNSTNKNPKSAKDKTTYNDTDGNEKWAPGKVWTLNEMLQRTRKAPIEVYTLSDNVTVDFYDNGVVDNDSVSIIYNNNLLVRKEMLEASKSIHLTLKISDNPTENTLIVFAENLGKEAPNSALVVITDNKGKRTEVSVFSDLEHNAVIKFIKGVKNN